MAEYANVIVDISHERLDRVFQYRIPESLRQEIQAGSRVLVPFGKGNRLVEGYVTEVTDRAEWEPDKIKELSGTDQEGIPVEAELIALAGWIRQHYGSTMIQALKTVMPVKEKMRAREEKWVCLQLSPEELDEALTVCRKKHQTARARLFQALKENPRLPWAAVTGELKLSRAALKPLEEKGQIRV